jgi:transposase
MLNPYMALGGVGLLIAATTGAFFEGKHVAKGEVATHQLNQLVKALDDRDAKQKQIDALEHDAAQREQQRQVEVREVYREIPKIVRQNSVVYDRTCIDDAGVHALARARSAAIGEHPGAAPGQAEPGATGGDDGRSGNAPGNR